MLHWSRAEMRHSESLPWRLLSADERADEERKGFPSIQTAPNQGDY